MCAYMYTPCSCHTPHMSHTSTSHKYITHIRYTQHTQSQHIHTCHTHATHRCSTRTTCIDPQVYHTPILALVLRGCHSKHLLTPFHEPGPQIPRPLGNVSLCLLPPCLALPGPAVPLGAQTPHLRPSVRPLLSSGLTVPLPSSRNAYRTWRGSIPSTGKKGTKPFPCRALVLGDKRARQALTEGAG